MMIVYSILWAVSRFTFYIFVEIIGLVELMSWAINATAFGFLTLVGLRF